MRSGAWSLRSVALDGASVLVKPEVAQRQRDEEAGAQPELPSSLPPAVVTMAEGGAEAAPVPGSGVAPACVTLEIHIEAPNGIPEDRVRIVTETCNTLKFKGHGFEET